MKITRRTASQAGELQPGPGASGVRVLRGHAQAAALLHHPVRVRILEALMQPDSAAGLARRMRVPRQTLNYHVRALQRAGLLARAGRRKNRNFFEQRYVTTARGFVLSPELLGRVAADPAVVKDRVSAAYLLALASLMQREIAQVTELADQAGKRVATLSIETRVRFHSAEQRSEFAEALRSALFGVAERHAAPYQAPDGSDGEGRGFRLVLGCYPLPPQAKKVSENDKETSHE